MTVCEVRLWGTSIGAVSAEAGAVAAFQWNAEFAAAAGARGIEPAPLQMPLDPDRVYRFPTLAAEAFHGLPGMLADSLPDRWGTRLIAAWLASGGRDEASFDAAERLCYTGSRGMGALEFRPATAFGSVVAAEAIDVAALVEVAAAALRERAELATRISEGSERHGVEQILQVGTSAGGARAKAVIAFNEASGEVRSGQLDAPAGFRHWLLKFDGVGGGDHGLRDPDGWGPVEYAYHLMARAAGIEMTDCLLLAEGPRRHFMTRRFDRGEAGDRAHVQTIAALAHVDYNTPRAYSYEQALQLVQRLTGDTAAAEQLVRRMAFNVLARNRDDHVKNTAFSMDRRGRWCLTPAYDLTLAYVPGNRWLDAHQMTINGKGTDISEEDLLVAAAAGGVKRPVARHAIAAVHDAIVRWPACAEQAEIPKRRASDIAALHVMGPAS